MKGLIQGVIDISEMCGVSSIKPNITANLILYQLLQLHKKVFGSLNTRLWQPVTFPSEIHRINCVGISQYMNGLYEEAKKTWKNAIKADPYCIHALHNLNLLTPLKADHYLTYFFLF